MTDNHTREPSPEESASEGSHDPPEEGSTSASEAEETVAKMEKGIENVDDEIDNAKEKAVEAERFDPHSQTTADDKQPRSQTSAEDGDPNTNH
ncbi:MAG TPA: hypothetical protein VHV50_01795 [Actinomycetota bacterium]|jgi:hypothetical protein|nr:hypothetical protein [Actinomycetota bacterium]